ncbi:Protein phosphatase 2C 2 [Coemansia brasiliensis]|uniref:protein-serine/threonine phosphatase n=1 Tax=Coemansia brasiliensis TaxID=2650707 RepID=A0A9W8M0S6_9FUNG|nr:Protein phosphatase 2C 2 [Coemansia brasiliensis]
MEDAHTTVLKLGPDGESAFFAVYDGHGGQAAAKFSGAELHSFIVKDENYTEGKFEDAIKSGYMAADAVLRENPEMTNDSSGCTAVSILLTKDGKVFCGNAGDSRCIISSKGQAEALSHDHKPTDDVEFNRIVSGGGFVEFGRVNGNLALSRAIGDFEFKNNRTLPAEKQIVTAYPDVVGRALTADDEFIVIACDGIWDCMTNEQVVQFVHAKVLQGLKLDRICEEMMDRCLAGESELGGVGCDNMTVIIVGLLNGKTEEEWYAYVKKIAEESGQKSSPKINRSANDSEMGEDSNAILNAIISQATAQDSSDDDDESKHAAAVDAHADVADVPAVTSTVSPAAAAVPSGDLAEEPKPAETKAATEEQPAAEAKTADEEKKTDN